MSNFVSGLFVELYRFGVGLAMTGLATPTDPPPCLEFYYFFKGMSKVEKI